MKFNESFKAIQGEGVAAGLPVYFVRLSGCNLSCDFCDTKYHKEGNEKSVDDVCQEIVNSEMETVVFTGGEPLLQINEIEKVMKHFPKHDFHLETNGTIYDERVDYFNIINCSPKKQGIKKLETFIKYNSLPQTYFKFVYENSNDCWWEDFSKKVGIPKHKIFIMPEGMTRWEQQSKMPEVMEYCLKNNYNFSGRLHVLAYNKRRGV